MPVKVWNDNKHPYKENFKGQNILIEPGKYILMEEDDAILFRGTMPPSGIMVDADGNHDARGYKMIRIEGESGTQTEKKTKFISSELTCQSCKYHGANKSDLDEHISANHLEVMVDEKEVQKRRSSRREETTL